MPKGGEKTVYQHNITNIFEKDLEGAGQINVAKKILPWSRGVSFLPLVHPRLHVKIFLDWIQYEILFLAIEMVITKWSLNVPLIN